MIEGNASHEKKKQGQSMLKGGYETALVMSKAYIVVCKLMLR